MTDQIMKIQATLSRIEERLDRIENDAVRNFPIPTNIAKLILDFRREREAFFPDHYFSDHGWDMLLVLHKAELKREKLDMDMLAQQAGISRSIASRYLDVMMQDGFVYCEDSISGNNRSFMFLTQKGQDRLTALFQNFQIRVTRQPKSTDNQFVKLAG